MKKSGILPGNPISIEIDEMDRHIRGFKGSKWRANSNDRSQHVSFRLFSLRPAILRVMFAEYIEFKISSDGFVKHEDSVCEYDEV